MLMQDGSAQFKPWCHQGPRMSAFRGRLGIGIAVMFFCAASVIPATANGQSISRNNATWHTVKASQVSENGSSEALGQEVEVAQSGPPRSPAAKALFPISPLGFRKLAGALALQPLRSPPVN